MEIIIYDSNLERIGVIDNFHSLIWTRKFYEPGSFELHLPLTAENIAYAREENIVAKKGSIESGVIESISITDGEKRSLVVKGRFLSSYLERRLIKRFTFNGRVEEAMKQMIQNSVSIPKLNVEANKGFTEIVTFQATMKNLNTIISKLSKSSNIGYRIVADFKSKKLLFDVYKGIDHTLGQFDNTRVVFSTNYQNLNDSSYSFDSMKTGTKAFVGGEGEGTNRIYVEVGSGSGLNLREVFVDAKDIRSNDFSTNAQYLDALRQKGYEELNKLEPVESFDCGVEPKGNFIYKEDYDLGDVVTLIKEDWGLKIDKRITEIQEVYENGGMAITPILGNPFPEKLDIGE